MVMTYDEMLQQRLQALLKTISDDTMSDLLIEEYERIHRELDERQFRGPHSVSANVMPLPTD